MRGATGLPESKIRPALKVMWYCRQLFVGALVRVTKGDYQRLGISPQFFKRGALFFLLEKASEGRLSAVRKRGYPQGFYPMSENGDLNAFLQGRIAYLPERSRVIALPKGFNPSTVFHEILHDIFAGGGLSVSERQEFVRNVLNRLRDSGNPDMPDSHKNAPFFAKVAEICSEKYDIGAISPLYNVGRPWEDPDFMIFAGECFAYAGEFMLHPQAVPFDAIPKEMESELRFMRIFDRAHLDQVVRLVSNALNPGNEVSIHPLSSTTVSPDAASPAMASAMAMRWSP